MANSIFRIKYEVHYPLVSPCAKLPKLRSSQFCQLPGMFVEFMEIIANSLNLTIEARFGLDGDNMSELKNGTFDTVSALMDDSSLFSEDLDFTIPVYYATTKLAVRHADKLNNNRSIFQFLNVYSYGVWLMIVLVCIGFALFGIFIRVMEYRFKISEKFEFDNICWKFLRLNIRQYQEFEFHLLSGNFSILIFSFMQCILMISMYNSLIKTETLQNIKEIPFQENDLIKVLQEGKFSFVFNDEYVWFYQDILNSSRSPYYEIRQTLDSNPIEFTSDDDVSNEELYLKKLLEKGNKIAVLEDDEKLSFSADNYCDLVYIESPFPPRSKHFLFRKNHPLLPEINRVILEQEVYFIRIYNKYLKYKPLSNCTIRDLRPKALTIKPYLIIFIMLGIGLLFGFFIFVIELRLKRVNVNYSVRIECNKDY